MLLLLPYNTECRISNEQNSVVGYMVEIFYKVNFYEGRRTNLCPVQFDML